MKKAAVLGSHVSHSLSPTLHNAAYRNLGLEKDYHYGLQNVTGDQIGQILDQLDHTWAGLSLTMPLKQVVIPHLDLLAPTARLTHSVNTLLIAPDTLGGELDAGPRPAGRPGLLIGANTDVYGIKQSLSDHLEGPPRRAVIIGARATASSALAAVYQLGVRQVGVIARRLTGAGSILEVATKLGIALDHVTFEDEPGIVRLLGSADVAVSTVPEGVADQLAPAVQQRDMTGRVLLDAVYQPWPTVIAAAWQDRGGAIAPGWSMLMHQAWLQVRLMTGGREAEVPAMREALLAEWQRRRAGGEPEISTPYFNL